jgi:predicted Fe-Mo cluster-binding NifX family protein
MRVAVSSTGPDPGSPVDARFGRADWFVVIDTSTGESKAVDNEAGARAGSGAGVHAAEAVVREGVEYVLTGHCGPNAFRALDAAGVKVVVDVGGTVQEAVDRLKAGELSPVTKPDVQGHAG